MALLIERMWNDDLYTAEVVGTVDGKLLSIKGLITSELRIHFSHEWSNLESELGLDMGIGLNNALKQIGIGVASLLSEAGGGEISNLLSQFITAKKRIVHQTLVFWKDTTVSGIDVNLLVINFNGKLNPLKIYKEIAPKLLPFRKGLLFMPPHGYTVTVDFAKMLGGAVYQGPPGTLGFRYSNWFEAYNFFVLKSFNATFSEERLRDGSPLYAEFSISLEPFIEVSADVFTGWIKA